jgi:hypothetical protein
MAEEYYDYEDEHGAPPARDHLFLWTVFILLLIGAAFACWLGSFYIFGHPEKPRPYKILKKLNKIEPPKRFEVTAAPTGEFLTPKKLFERYANMKNLELAQENDTLLRNYIKNYKETKKLVPYITGRFEIIDTYELKQTDMFPSGVVAVGISEEMPQVLLEHVFTQSETAPRANLPQGLDIRLERTRDLAAIVHVERNADGHMQFTAMPLAYGTWAVKGSVGVFSLEPPPGLRLEAGLPIVRGQTLQTALAALVERRRSKPRPTADETEKAAPNEPELVRLDTVKPGTAVPETGALPDLPVATPIPIAGAKPRPQATPMVVASNSTPVPKPFFASPPPRVEPPPRVDPAPQVAPPARLDLPPMAAATTPVPVATPLPRQAPAPAPAPAPLKSFFGSVQQPGMGMPGAWKVYPPGRQPAGRTVTATEAGVLAERGGLNERTYLRGNFVVTAAGEGRAVLRAQGSGAADPNNPGAGSARVIVEFPPSVAPPTEGSTFARDELRGFEVREVRKGADGQVNIWVREVTQPE